MVKPVSRKIMMRAKEIKLVVLDVDGVLTDGGIFLDSRGQEIKRFDVKDGQGISLLINAGITVALLSGRSSPAVRRRAKELGIQWVFQGVTQKLAAYEDLKDKTGFSDREIAYMGDDVQDLPIIEKAGMAVAVRDAWEGIAQEADFVTEKSGGHGAVRELADLILRARKNIG